MTDQPEIKANSTEERIRAIAYALWEAEGHPHGRELDHWQRACELVAAEDAAANSTAPKSPEPTWLERKGTDLPRDPARKIA